MVIHKKIKTTDAKGKELRGFVERLVTYAKKGDVHGRRLIQSKIRGRRGKEVANILIHDIAPAFQNRQGGYTRIIKLNYRKNDKAPVSLVEFVDISPSVIEKSETEESVEKEQGESKE